MLLQNFISVRNGPEKVQKQGGDETVSEANPASAVYFLQMLDSPLAFLHFCLVSVLFQAYP